MQRMDQETINREHMLARHVRIVERFAEKFGKLIKQQEALKKERRKIVSARIPDKVDTVPNKSVRGIDLDC